MINAQQMEEMRRAFYMMDTNGDGVVCQEDLETIFENLGISDDAYESSFTDSKSM